MYLMYYYTQNNTNYISIDMSKLKSWKSYHKMYTIPLLDLLIFILLGLMLVSINIFYT